jgi:hypothetical protein
MRNIAKKQKISSCLSRPLISRSYLPLSLSSLRWPAAWSLHGTEEHDRDDERPWARSASSSATTAGVCSMDGRSDELPENGTYSFLPSRSSCHHRHYAPNRRNPHRIERHRHLVAACRTPGDGPSPWTRSTSRCRRLARRRHCPSVSGSPFN